MLDDLTQELDFGIDWELANEDAERWARQYGYALVNRLNNTTRRRLAAEIAEWTQNSETINQLAGRLAGLFDARRAKTIAVTEVTRAYAQGNQAAWARSKVIDAKRWNTANDELVCPICGPLNGRIVPLTGTFDGIDNPPAHPNCRCWITPVVMEVEDVASVEDAAQGGGSIPAGTPVSNAIQIPNRGKYSEVYRETLAAIDSVHGDGNLPTIPVKTKSNMQSLGQYRYFNENRYRGTPFKSVEIFINGKGSHQKLTLAHEIGHFIDIDAIGQGRTAGMRYGPFSEAVQNSGAYQKLKAMRASPDDYAVTQSFHGRSWQSPPSVQHLDYLLDDSEVWARAYSQYIAEKSRDPDMLEQLAGELEDERYGARQWDADDFRPISAAIDTLFKALGWLQ